MEGADGIHEIIARYSDLVYRLAFARTRSKADAEDIYQEVFLKLFTASPVFESEEHRKAWLIRATAHASINLFRSAWRRHTTLTEAPTEAKISSVSPWEPLYEALEHLPGRTRLAIHLFYDEDMTAEEIAQTLGEKPATIRSRLARGRKKLRALLDEREGKRNG